MLQVSEQQHHTTKVFTLTGQYGRRTTPGIQARILGAKEMGIHHIILDFSRVTEIDSTSLSKLFSWYHNMKSDHVQVSMVKPPAPIWTPYYLLHVPYSVQIYASLEEVTWGSTAYS